MTWGPFMRVEIAQEFAALERAEWPAGFGPWMPNRERGEDRAAQLPADVVAACEREQERQRGIARRAAKREELRACWRERGRQRAEARRAAKGAA